MIIQTKVSQLVMKVVLYISLTANFVVAIVSITISIKGIEQRYYFGCQIEFAKINENF